MYLDPAWLNASFVLCLTYTDPDRQHISDVKQSVTNRSDLLPAMSPQRRKYCCLCAAPCLPHHAADGASPSTNPQNPIPGRSWLTHYTALHLSSGASPQNPSSSRPLISNSRPVFIHTYCLSSALRLMSSDHSRRMLQAWSLPKWTGWVNWDLPYPGITAPGSTKTRGGPARIGGELDGRCWAGLEAQLDRWKRGESPFLPVSR